MACEIVTFKRVVLVVWGKPVLQDLGRILAEVERTYADHGPVVFIARIPAQAEPPEEHVRRAVTDQMTQLRGMCASFHVIIEGTGFAAAAKRTALATIFLMTGKRADYRVHGTADEVPGSVQGDRRAEVVNALQRFRPRGLLDRRLESLRPPPQLHPT